MRPERTTDVTAKCIYNRLKNTRIISTQGRARKFTPPPWYKGRGERDGWNPGPPRSFDVLQYFETILPLVQSP